MGDAVANPGKKGWLVSILELGAWLGVLMTGGTNISDALQPEIQCLLIGYFADKLSRKYTILLGKYCPTPVPRGSHLCSLAVVVFCVGVIVQTTAKGPPSIFGGRFITGLGVGSLSMAVPLYNSEMSPPEVRGSLVALQQLVCEGIVSRLFF